MRHVLNMLSPGTIRLAPFHERLVWIVFALLLASGGAWLVLEHYVVVEGDYGPSRHPAQALVLKAHGVLAMLGVWGFGALWALHIRRGWAAGRHRRSGGILFACTVVLAVTGLLLYYASGDALRAWSSLVHWVVGVGSAAALLAHAVLVPRLVRASGTLAPPSLPPAGVPPLQPSGSSSR